MPSIGEGLGNFLRNLNRMDLHRQHQDHDPQACNMLSCRLNFRIGLLEWKSYVVPHHLEIGPIKKVRDVRPPSREVVVHTEHLISPVNQLFAQMASKKSRATRDQNTTTADGRTFHFKTPYP
jgi:hypothetical protein